MTDFLRNSILAALAYYDILDLPLSLIEIHKYLINPARIKTNGPIGNIKISDIDFELTKLEKSGSVEMIDGFYFLQGRSRIYLERIRKERISYEKWKIFLNKSEIFQSVPYLRGFFASGSMAINNTDEESDYDVLVISQNNRIYTCRIFLLLATSLMSSRRKRYDRIAPDKFCFNHYISSNALEIRHQSLFNAQSYANLKPVFVNPKILNEFYDSNKWINKYLYNFKPSLEFSRRRVKKNSFFISISKIIEFILNNSIGDLFESLFRKYQQKRIRLNPATYEKDGRVVYSDDELEFHPRSFERIVIDRYNTTLEKMAIMVNNKEEDSGLN